VSPRRSSADVTVGEGFAANAPEGSQGRVKVGNARSDLR
jgi:hypothetical protein